MSTSSFDLESGALCLDFANTVEWHASDQPHDGLAGYADLLAWGEAAGILRAGQGESLRRLAEQRPEAAAAALERAVTLREAIYRIFVTHSQGEGADPADLAILNDFLGASLARLRLSVAPAGFAWNWSGSPADLERPLWPVARSAGELLTSPNLDRVAQCADDRGCGYLFVDTSRNQSRRWCSMESCGNRAKARRHYRRQQQDA